MLIFPFSGPRLNADAIMTVIRNVSLPSPQVSPVLPYHQNLPGSTGIGNYGLSAQAQPTWMGSGGHNMHDPGLQQQQQQQQQQQSQMSFGHQQMNNANRGGAGSAGFANKRKGTGRGGGGSNFSGGNQKRHRGD
jgi:hypothetical protein